MLFEKNAQGISITVIVAAVIGLIILVVIIAMLTGKLGAFGKGVESATSCENFCRSFGKIYSGLFTEKECSDAGHQVMPGVSVQDPEKACCCINPSP